MTKLGKATEAVEKTMMNGSIQLPRFNRGNRTKQGANDNRNDRGDKPIGKEYFIPSLR
jgi:hypothetical protein